VKGSGSKGSICTLSEYVQTQEYQEKLAEMILVDRTKAFCTIKKLFPTEKGKMYFHL
jgi:hypothetical protein